MFGWVVPHLFFHGSLFRPFWYSGYTNILKGSPLVTFSRTSPARWDKLWPACLKWKPLGLSRSLLLTYCLCSDNLVLKGLLVSPMYSHLGNSLHLYLTYFQWYTQFEDSQSTASLMLCTKPVTWPETVLVDGRAKGQQEEEPLPHFFHPGAFLWLFLRN